MANSRIPAQGFFNELRVKINEFFIETGTAEKLFTIV